MILILRLRYCGNQLTALQKQKGLKDIHDWLHASVLVTPTCL